MPNNPITAAVIAETEKVSLSEGDVSVIKMALRARKDLTENPEAKSAYERVLAVLNGKPIPPLSSKLKTRIVSQFEKPSKFQIPKPVPQWAIDMIAARETVKQ